MSDPGTRPDVHLRINGERIATGSGGVHGHVNPSTGEVDAKVPLAGPEEVERAVQAAHEAFPAWRALPPGERRRMLLALADALEAQQAELALRGTMDVGTPAGIVGGMVAIAIEWTRYYAGLADKVTGETTTSYSGGVGELGFTVPQPYGVIGMITTWNAPIVSLAMKVPAALAAGNTVVLKPSELAPFTAELFADCVEAAGIPAGVVNVVPGDAAAGAALVAHPLVEKVSFTGGPATAKKILGACAELLKPTVMELGGKSANIVFDDADLDAAIGYGVFMSIGVMSGQGCLFPTRMLVQRGVYDDVLARVELIASMISVGDPFDAASIAGPVISEDALQRVLGMVERAQADGARLVCGGGRIGETGYFVQPTVLADVDPASELAQQEVFGPVLAITPFDTEEEAVQIANSTAYGLSGYVQTRDLKRGLRVAEQLRTGEVLVNGAQSLRPQRPFGGLGLSGFGKEGGRAGLEEFQRHLSIAIA